MNVEFPLFPSQYGRYICKGGGRVRISITFSDSIGNRKMISEEIDICPEGERESPSGPFDLRAPYIIPDKTGPDVPITVWSDTFLEFG